MYHKYIILIKVLYITDNKYERDGRGEGGEENEETDKQEENRGRKERRSKKRIGGGRRIHRMCLRRVSCDFLGC